MSRGSCLVHRRAALRPELDCGPDRHRSRFLPFTLKPLATVRITASTCSSLLSLGPKHCIEPVLNRPEKLAAARMVSRHVPDEEKARKVLVCRDSVVCREPRHKTQVIQISSPSDARLKIPVHVEVCFKCKQFLGSPNMLKESSQCDAVHCV
ncbi:hypothetical protein HPB50_002262 [Hyalomma asiaticum]|uniref:Uncharacterized protein n=1 Tax=Hyalomma asiaticum TaxID=266040 RepID=A0ACB7TB08_HYAAI|nr:hypothetical protein HPB50_002262 [Hyalomma asiaticum]